MPDEDDDDDDDINAQDNSAAVAAAAVAVASSAVSKGSATRPSRKRKLASAVRHNEADEDTEITALPVATWELDMNEVCSLTLTPRYWSLFVVTRMSDWIWRIVGRGDECGGVQGHVSWSNCRHQSVEEPSTGRGISSRADHNGGYARAFLSNAVSLFVFIMFFTLFLSSSLVSKCCVFLWCIVETTNCFSYRSKKKKLIQKQCPFKNKTNNNFVNIYINSFSSMVHYMMLCEELVVVIFHFKRVFFIFYFCSISFTIL